MGRRSRRKGKLPLRGEAPPAPSIAWPRRSLRATRSRIAPANHRTRPRQRPLPRSRRTGPAAVAPTPKDPREATLASTVLQLLEQRAPAAQDDRRLRSARAFATYLDRLDGGKLFLLKPRPRRARASTPTRSTTSSTPASSSSRTKARRCSTPAWPSVDKMVAELLAKPLDHDDDEYVELDPKKVQPPRPTTSCASAGASGSSSRCWSASTRWRSGSSAEAKAAKAPKDSQGEGRAKTDGQEGRRSLDAARDRSRRRPRRARRRRAPISRRATRPVRAAPRTRHRSTRRAISSTRSRTTLDPHTDYLPPADKANFDIADERLARGHRRRRCARRMTRSRSSSWCPAARLAPGRARARRSDPVGRRTRATTRSTSSTCASTTS